MNTEKLKEIIFDDSYAYNELEAYEKEFGEEKANTKELRKAVKWYYDILQQKPSEMAMNFLKNLIDRKTFTPIYNNEGDWMPTDDPDICTHKRRVSVIRIKRKDGTYAYTDMDAVEMIDQNMKKVTDQRLINVVAYELSLVEFPYMFTGKVIVFVAMGRKAAKIVSLRTSQGTTAKIGKCYKFTEHSLEDITEEEFQKILAVEAGEDAIEAAKKNSQN